VFSELDSTNSARRIRFTFYLFEILAAIGLGISFVSWSAGGILGSVQTQISRNSEAFALALMVAVELHLRRVKRDTAWLYTWWLLLLTGYFITELFVRLPAAITTLNEAFLAAIIISTFLTYFGPSSGRWSTRWIYPAIAGVVVVVGELSTKGLPAMSDWIIGSAETWGFVILITVLFGLISGFPWPEAAQSRSVHVVWVLFLVLTPAIGSILNKNGVDSTAAVGFLESTLVWVQRVTEAFVAALGLTFLVLVLENLTQSSTEGEKALPA
jgi:hypothetical protein